MWGLKDVIYNHCKKVMTTLIIKWSLKSTLVNAQTLVYSNYKKVYIYFLTYLEYDLTLQIVYILFAKVFRYLSVWYFFLHTSSKKVKCVVFTAFKPFFSKIQQSCNVLMTIRIRVTFIKLYRKK